MLLLGVQGGGGQILSMFLKLWIWLPRVSQDCLQVNLKTQAPNNFRSCQWGAFGMSGMLNVSICLVSVVYICTDSCFCSGLWLIKSRIELYTIEQIRQINYVIQCKFTLIKARIQTDWEPKQNRNLNRVNLFGLLKTKLLRFRFQFVN